jgi:hypothetical protein
MNYSSVFADRIEVQDYADHEAMNRDVKNQRNASGIGRFGYVCGFVLFFVSKFFPLLSFLLFFFSRGLRAQ